MTGSETPKRSLFTLIGALPTLLVDLVKSELALLKAELTEKLKNAGIGIGLMAGAAAFAFFALGVLVAAAVLGLAVVLPGWAAALIVAAVLLLVAAGLVLLGVRQLKRGTPPAPEKTIQSVHKDVNAIKGIGKRA
jgi:uncharacterized membrane protein YqjE